MMLPYAGNKYMSPFEAVHGRQPTALERARLRTPFCTVYCKKETTNAREKKHEIGIFIGYSEMGKYRVFYPWRLKLKAMKYAGQTKVIFEEKQIIWDESLNHTTERFNELRKFRDFHVLYEAEPVVPRNQVQVSLALPTDRETRSMAKLRKSSATTANVSTRKVRFARFNLVLNGKNNKKYHPQTVFDPARLKSTLRHRASAAQTARIPPPTSIKKSEAPEYMQTDPKSWTKVMAQPDAAEWEAARKKEEDGFDGPNLPKPKIIRLHEDQIPKGATILRGQNVLNYKRAIRRR